MDIDGDLSHCTRDSNLWFADGSVVLRADDTLFRVYSGILSQASPVFKDMFTIPQPTTDECESYDGCPLVHAPDSAQDLRPFLRALHDCSQFNVGDLTMNDIPMIVSVLRLSTKYEVQCLRKRAIEALLRWYPPTLKEYMPFCGSAHPAQDHPWHVLVANAARETDVPVLLPTALLLCASTANSYALYDGLVRDDIRYTLADANKRALFVGRSKLAHAARSRTQACFFYPRDTSKCKAPHRCDEFCRIYASVFDGKDDPWMNPFYKISWKAVQSTCCSNCAISWEQHHSEECELVWKEFPTYFGLPDWNTLVEQFKVTES